MSGSSLKRRLLFATIGAVALTLALITVAFNLILDRSLTSDAKNVVQSRVQAGRAVVDFQGNHLRVEQAPDESALDERVWIYEGRRALNRADAPAEVQAAVATLAGSPVVITRDVGNQRLLVHPVFHRGVHIGAVVGSVSLVPYRHSQKIALVGSLLFSLAILAALALTARMLIGRALRPVAKMTAQAAAWSDHDVDRRFALGPPRDELTGLAATLDALLGRLSASLRHEKHLSAELAHELRTPLSKLHAEAELALARDRPAGELRAALEEVLGYTERMTAVVNTLMAAAEREADPHSGSVDARDAAQAAVAACAGSAAERGISLTAAPVPAPIEVNADADLTVQLLTPLLENAIRYGHSQVRLSVGREGEAVAFRVTDDGPGLESREIESVFVPGVRGSAAGSNGGSGAGLGLALARRLARAAGGDVVAEAAPAGGHFVVRLPAS
ncbi:MAG: two-component system, OmpR family, sensor kinase [Thermoleophilaceae bacterium]|nr:two-component system, OmpR family, sensor kinase [Thermoleophilaceae bacterium]